MPANVHGHTSGQPFVPPGMTPRPGGVPGHGAPYGVPPQGMWRPQAQPATTAVPAAAAQRPAAHPQQALQVKCEWTEHTAPDGRKYYYNAGTKASVWQKPKAYADAELEAQAAQLIADCPWKEHTAPDGRSYFHNRTLSRSVWKIPDELAAAQAEAARLRAQITGAPAAAAAAAMGAAAAAAAPTAAATAKTGEFMYATPEEAKAAFKAMLSHVQAPQDSKWDKISARIEAAGDARFKALKTNGQRASCYKEWVRLTL
jgi:pre-mRNA-processing factor 40